MLRTRPRLSAPARRVAIAATAVLALALAGCGPSEEEQLQQDIEELATQVCAQLRTASPEDGFLLLGMAGTAVQEAGGTNQQLSAALREECPEEMEFYRQAVEGIGSRDDGDGDGDERPGADG